MCGLNWHNTRGSTVRTDFSPPGVSLISCSGIVLGSIYSGCQFDRPFSRELPPNLRLPFDDFGARHHGIAVPSGSYTDITAVVLPLGRDRCSHGGTKSQQSGPIETFYEIPVVLCSRFEIGVQTSTSGKVYQCGATVKAIGFFDVMHNMHDDSPRVPIPRSVPARKRRFRCREVITQPNSTQYGNCTYVIN